ncbi:MAG TPA: nuclear transport factor 2 family protein [Myxococcota bacterium]|nr:nuclear transport factor 2 family protein [Myxococcota bacterium]
MATKGKKKTRRKPARKAAARRSAKKPGSSLDAFARRIVKLTNQPHAALRELYAENCTSIEASGNTVTGMAGLEAKLEQWEQMQSGTTWKARNVWTGKNKICIEWDAVVHLRDGRTVKLSEIAIHELKGGKIAAERFYYNPGAFAPPAGGAS